MKTSPAKFSGNDPLPLRGPGDPASAPRLAPPWVSLGAAWLGLLTLLAALALPLVPGSRHPRQELERHGYSAADKFILVPVYGSIITLFLGVVVLWQMRREARPLPQALAAQRVQAWTGIVLATVAVIVFYAWVHVLVAWRNPGVVVGTGPNR